MARVTVGLLAAAAIVPASAVAGQAITGTVDASAYGVGGNVTLLGAASVPIANTPNSAYPGGPASASTLSVSVPLILNTGVINTTATGDPLADTAGATAGVAGLGLLGSTVGASAISSSCTGTGSAVSASSTITGLSIPLAVQSLPGDNPAPNTRINLTNALGLNIADVILNEQTLTTVGGVRTVKVTALHLHLLGGSGLLGAVGSGDVYVGHSECSTTVPSTPTVSAISPTQGPQVGGTTVTIDGTNFLGVTQVLIGGNPAAFTQVSLTRLTASTPAHSPGATSVQVSNPNGTVTAAQQFTYLATPAVTTVSPNSGPAAGGTTVTITGSGFTGVTGLAAVTFGGTPATSYTVVNPTTITAVVPAGTGVDQVVITGTGGTSPTGAASTYTYLDVPTLASISPASGPVSGGTTVTLTGTGFTADSAVTVDGADQAVTFVNSTTLRITTPAHSAGTAAIKVTTGGGASSTQTFTYLAVPTVSGISPSYGSSLGGDTVSITGTGLGGVTAVSVDGTAVPIGSRSATSLAVTTPSHLPGPVNVVLTGPGGATIPAGTFTYILPGSPAPGSPTVTSLTPATGTVSGGTSVAITGTNFTGATDVTFGGVAATSFTVNSATSITAIAPAGTSAGPVSVLVTNPVAVSDVSVGGTYLYQALSPGLASLSPNHGPDSGGTTVTLTGTSFTLLSTVTLDGTSNLPVTYVDGTHLTVTMPPHVAGTVGLQVMTGVLSSGTLTYTYDPTPTVSGFSPASGTTAGGTTVTVTGADLTAVNYVSVNGTVITPASKTATTLTFVTPAHTAGLVNVLLRDGTTAGNSTFSVIAGSYTYVAPAPTISSIVPSHGPLAGNNNVTVNGTNLGGTSAVTIGGITAPIVGTPTGTAVVVTVPASTLVGPVAVTLTAPGGTANSSYTYDALPTITLVSPVQGADDGGTAVTITGSGFSNPATVRFGANPATGVTVVNATTITATSPAGAPGLVDITVTTDSGTSEISSADRFTYLNTHAAPTVGGVNPDLGPTAGGTSVTLTGTGFTGATSVTIGATVLPIGGGATVVSDTSITLTTPADAAGQVNVQVTTPNGTSVTNANAKFTYVTPGTAPVISQVSPAAGPPAGANTVTITGIGFTGTTSVTFAGSPPVTVASGDAVIVNDTTITVVVPAHAPGEVDVTLAHPAGASAVTAVTRYTYVAAATVATINPGSGPATGGTTVTLTGDDFTDATSVTFGGVAGTSLSISNDSLLTVVTPAHAAGVGLPVVVVGVGGSSSGTPTFTYTAVAPVVSGVSPSTGKTGDVVAVTGSGFSTATAIEIDGGATIPIPSPGVVTVNSDSSISLTLPGRSAGTYHVRLVGPGGASADTAADQITYAVVPGITNIAPPSGPAAGGNTVTITGTGFSGATAVTFNGAAGTNLAVSGSTGLTVTAPSGTGTVSVTVTAPGGTSSGFPYTYNALPTISSLAPNNGPTSGATSVTINGAGLSGTTSVTFGGVNATITSITATQVVVTTPAHVTGTVQVQVLGSDGATANTAADDFTYNPPPAPTTSTINPASGPAAGGTTVTISGTNFTGATSVTFGGVAGTNLAVGTATSLTVTTPGHAAGVVPVVVTGPGGVSSGLTYQFDAAPAIASVTPNSGSTDGGQTVTIAGTGFLGASAVSFGGTNGTIFGTPTSTSITVTTPAHTAGPVDIRVTTPNGTSPIAAPNDRFTFTAPAPTVSGISPGTGPLNGGTAVTITGTGFTGATLVNFGSGASTPTVISDTQITVVTPAGPATGPVNVTVTTPDGGTSPVGATFTYTLAVPSVSAVSPSAGDTGGGTFVTITGTGFTGATGVVFGGVPATGFTVVNDTTITATSPTHGSGSATVSVSGPGGTSSGGPSFTYVAPGSAPVITGISPGRGPAAGGNTVTITGIGFTGATGVRFGGLAGTDLTVVNDTTITVVVPAGAGDVDVVVVGPNGSSAPGTSSGYGFVPLSQLPTVTTITPDVGPVAGGTTVTIRGSRFDEFTSVTFDGVPGTGLALGPDVGTAVLRSGVTLTGGSFRAAYSNVMTVDTPAHAQGPVNVVVTNAAGSISFTQAFTFIPALVSSTFSITVAVNSTTNVEPRGAQYQGLEIQTCSDTTGQGLTELAANGLSCSYAAPGAAGTDSFTLSVTDVLGQTATQTVIVTVTAADDGDGDGTGTGNGGGNDTDGNGNGDGNGDDDGNGTGTGTGTGTGGGNDTDGSSGSGSGADGLAFTGTPFLLVTGLFGGLVLLLLGTGLVTGDRWRNRHGQDGAGLTVAAAAGGRTGDDDPEDDDPHDHAA